MKYIIPILTFLLFLCGLLIFFGTLRFGIGFYTFLLTFGTFIGFIAFWFDKKVGGSIIFVVALGWLFRYFERASFLMLYDFQNSGRWVIVAVPLVLAFSLFGLIYKVRQEEKGKPFRLSFLGLAFIVFLSVGLLSFIRKTHTDEYNCWYYFDENNGDFKITFAVTPELTFETISNSAELKEIVKKHGMTYESREGYYCPETKVKIITRFKEIVGVKILGFHNTEVDKIIKLDNPVEIDYETIKGDRHLLQPEFTL